MYQFLKQYFAIIFLLIVFFTIGFLTLNQMLLYTPDCARYIAWANSLAQGRGFLDISLVEPKRYVIHAPLYSILLIPSALIAPMSIIGAKVTTLLFSLLSLWFFYFLVKKITGSNLTSWIATLLLAIHPLFFIYSTQVLSEIPFTVCLITFFLVALNLQNTESGNWKEYVFIIVIVSGILMREVGLSLMLSAVLYFIFEKKYQRAILVFLLSLFPYLLWILRNEIIVGIKEYYSLKNSAIFLNHMYTSDSVSFFVELLERLKVNIQVYWKHFVNLIFMPDILENSMGIIDESHSIIKIGKSIANIIQFPIFVISLGLCSYGGYVLFKKNRIAILVGIFLLIYLIPILIYPINDIRFLFPLVIIMIVVGIVGALEIINSINEVRRWLFIYLLLLPVLLIAIIPNLCWDLNYFYNSYAYKKNLELIESSFAKDEIESSKSYLTSEQLVGMWLVKNAKPNMKVMGVQKELFLWTGERTYVEAGLHLVQEDFDRLIRDYEPEFLITSVAQSGLRQFEKYIHLSKHYTFETVKRIGYLEILKIHSKEDTILPVPLVTVEDTLRALFRLGLMCQVTPVAGKADTLFQILANRTNNIAMVSLELGIAKELLGDYKSAHHIFDGFRSITQAGDYLRQTWFHKETIANRQMADTTSNKTLRANLYSNLSINYRELGYIDESYYLMKKSLEADSQFFPSLLFASIFLYKDKNIQKADKYLKKAIEVDSHNVVIKKLSVIIELEKKLLKTSDIKEKIKIQHQIAKNLIEIGMREDAIDVYLNIIRKKPDDVEAIRKLADLYEVKLRYSLSYKWYNKLLELEPENKEAQKKCQMLRSIIG